MNPAIQLTEPELKLLQTLVYEQCGMYFDDRRAHFLQDRLLRRLRACRLESFYSYYRLLTSREGRTELAALLENLTVNETSFFRNKPQLDLFHKTTLDELLHRKHQARDYSLRLWSAGCSTGQEPYTLAMLVCDALSYFLLRNAPVGQHPSPKPLVPSPWTVCCAILLPGQGLCCMEAATALSVITAATLKQSSFPRWAATGPPLYASRSATRSWIPKNSAPV